MWKVLETFRKNNEGPSSSKISVNRVWDGGRIMNKICQNVVKKDSWYPLIKHHVPLCYVVNVKSTWKISSIFVVLLENMNFNTNYLIECCQTDWRLLCIIYMSVGKEHMTFESYGVLASIMLFMWTNNGNLFRIFTLHKINFRELKPKHVKLWFINTKLFSLFD